MYRTTSDGSKYDTNVRIKHLTHSILVFFDLDELTSCKRRFVTSILHSFDDIEYFQKHKHDIGPVTDMTSFINFAILQQIDYFNNNIIRPDFFQRLLCTASMMECTLKDLSLQKTTK